MGQACDVRQQFVTSDMHLDDVPRPQATNNQKMNRMATQRKSCERKRSSSRFPGMVPCPPWARMTGSPKLKVEENSPNGNAPIPKDI